MMATNLRASQKTFMDDLVRDLRSKYVTMFLDSPPGFARFDHRFTQEEQLETEKKLDRFINDTIIKAKGRHESTEGRMAEVEKLKASVKGFVAKSLWSPQKNVETDFLDDFSSIGDEFVHEARKFDPQLSLEDIHQALRNVWIINSLQVFLGKKVALTQSGFAYSLLYPYTDNYLDDPRVSVESKEEFVDALRGRLSGEIVRTRNPSLFIPFELIGMIEREYPRSSHPEVYLSFLGIHDAQEKALAQQGKLGSLDARDILELSVEKGGTSVLADGYLVDGTLEDEVKDFAFGLGVCLQMIDDLQDLEGDLRCGHRTLMTMGAAVAPLDALTNRLISFTTSVMELGEQFGSGEARALLELSRRSCVFLVLEAVARAMNKYTRDYVRALEGYSPLRFAYLKSLKENLRQKRNVLRRFEAVVPSEALATSR